MRVRWNPPRALGVICAALLALMMGPPHFTNASLPPRGQSDPVLALQNARDAGEVDAILADVPSPDREVMRIKQYEDFGFIVAYAALFGALGLGLRKRHRWALVIPVLGFAAALADAAENGAILRLLDLTLAQTSAEALRRISTPSVWKWALAAAATALLAWPFLRARGWKLRLVGLADVLGAGAVVAGLFQNSWLALGAALLFLGVGASAATLKVLLHEPPS